MNLTISDALRAGDYAAAVERMQSLCAAQDPEAPVDADAIRARYEATRTHLRSVVAPAPFRVVVEVVGR